MNYARSLGLLLFAVTAFARTIPVLCSTSSEGVSQELHLHRMAKREHDRLRKLGLASAVSRTSAGRDAGDIFVLYDADGVVARRNEFNLDYRTLRFFPVSGGRYRFELGADSYDDTGHAGATALALDDDDYRTFSLPFPFPFYGAVYQRVFINSDGNLTFVEGDGASVERSLGRLAGGPPRIAPLFEDLDPSRAAEGVLVRADANRLVVSWVRVPEYRDVGTGEPQTFQVRLYPDGRIEFAYSGVRPEAAVVGISPGRLEGSTAVVSFLEGSVAEYPATLAERFGGRNEMDLVIASHKFYESHDDAYDYLVFYNNLDLPAGDRAVASALTLRNHRSGYGRLPTDSGRTFGSASRLQAVLNMGALSQYPRDPHAIVPARWTARDTPLTVLAHEAGHLFLAYASIREPNDPRARPMLGYQGAHWNFAFNSDASLLEGNRIEDAGPGASPRFRTVKTVEAFSPLDQYLMGLRGPEEVEGQQRLFLVRNAPESFATRGPQPGISFDGARRDIAMHEIVRAEGRRTPDHTVSQRRFRFAFIFVVRQASEPTSEELAQLNGFRTAFEEFYRQATSGRAEADTALRRNMRLSVFPAAGVIEGRETTAMLTLDTAPRTPLTVSLQTRTGAALVPPSLTIAAGAKSASFAIRGVRAGVEEFSAVPGDALYDSAHARVQVAPPAMLKIAGVAESAGQAIVRVTDANNLPYPGVALRAGAVMTQTGADGQATVAFSGPTRVAIDQAPEAAPLHVGGGTVSAAAVVNAASFAATLAPGALATVFGGRLGGEGVVVRLNGREAPILWAGETQVNFLVPEDLPAGSAEVVVSNARGVSAAVQVPVAPFAPGIFFDPLTGFGAVLHAGTAETTFSRPAARGGYLEVYCTGLGAGRATATIGGVPAGIVYSGPAPGFPGLQQVNVQVPEGVARGAQPLLLAVEGRRSNEVKVAVD